MKVSMELKKEIGNAIAAYGQVLHSIILGTEVPSKFESLKSCSEKELQNKILILKEFYNTLEEEEKEEIYTFLIFEEGFMIQGMDHPSPSHYIGSAKGKNFIDACKNYIEAHPNCGGEIRKDSAGNEYAYNWGCRWFSSSGEASKSFG